MEDANNIRKNSSSSSLDNFHIILQNQQNKDYKDTLKNAIKLIKPDDDVVVIEDEKKFQAYFLEHKSQKPKSICFNLFKNKDPVTPDSELKLNKELLEGHQENCIEQEESIPAYTVPDQKYVKPEKVRRVRSDHRHIETLKTISPLFMDMMSTRIKEIWFKAGKFHFGLFGGSDHIRQPQTSEVVSETMHF